MQSALNEELRLLLIGTNDQRRRVGQALYHFYRTLAFGAQHGRTFLQGVRAWAPAGAAIFTSLSRTLNELVPHEEDTALRRYVGEVLRQLAADITRGDAMLHPYLRWLESRFPVLTALMQRESPTSRIHDFVLATELARTFGRIAHADRQEVAQLLGVLAETTDPRPSRA